MSIIANTSFSAPVSTSPVSSNKGVVGSTSVVNSPKPIVPDQGVVSPLPSPPAPTDNIVMPMSDSPVVLANPVDFFNAPSQDIPAPISSVSNIQNTPTPLFSPAKKSEEVISIYVPDQGVVSPLPSPPNEVDDITENNTGFLVEPSPNQNGNIDMLSPSDFQPDFQIDHYIPTNENIEQDDLGDEVELDGPMMPNDPLFPEAGLDPMLSGGGGGFGGGMGGGEPFPEEAPQQAGIVPTKKNFMPIIIVTIVLAVAVAIASKKLKLSE